VVGLDVMDCGLISENFMGFFEKKYERGEGTTGYIPRKFENFFCKMTGKSKKLRETLFLHFYCII